MSDENTINVDALYDVAQKYFEAHPDISVADKSKSGIVNAYIQALAATKNNPAEQTAPTPEPQQPAPTQQQQSQSDDLFGMLFTDFIRASLHEAMYHHRHWACPHGRFSHLSFGLPPILAGCHDRFCHRVDMHAAKNRVKTMTGTLNIADGIADITHGNTASGILGTISGAANIASVIVDKRRGR